MAADDHRGMIVQRNVGARYHQGVGTDLHVDRGLGSEQIGRGPVGRAEEPCVARSDGKGVQFGIRYDRDVM